MMVEVVIGSSENGGVSNALVSDPRWERARERMVVEREVRREAEVGEEGERSVWIRGAPRSVSDWTARERGGWVGSRVGYGDLMLVTGRKAIRV